MSKKYRVGILGATGMVGQRFIQLLVDHPQFEVTAVAASDRSQGKNYGEACTWRLSGDMPANVRDWPVQPPAPPLDCDLVFSSLPGEIARETSREIRRALFLLRHSTPPATPFAKQSTRTSSRSRAARASL